MAKKFSLKGVLGATAGATLVAVGVLSLMMFVVDVHPATASFSGQNGTIAWSHWTGTNGEIETNGGIFGSTIRITNTDNVSEFWPSYSPDGTRIVFAADQPFDPGSDMEIYTMSANGGSLKQVTDNDVYDGEPCYASIDGSRIAYEGIDGNNDVEIFTVDANGGTPHKVTDNNTSDNSPAYNHSLNDIAYSSYDGNDLEIFTIDANGGTPLKVTDNNTRDANPDYQPNGRRIVYSSFDGHDREISRVHRPWASGKIYEPVQITSNQVDDDYPVWSPDTQTIAFSQQDPILRNGQASPDWEIHTVPAFESYLWSFQHTADDKDDTSATWQSRR